MQFVAKARYIWCSPYKMRPLADVIRGKNAVEALHWLQTYKTQRSAVLEKVVASAAANAQNRAQIDPAQLSVKEIRIDQGPIHRYFKPGAMGRAMIQRKRLCHISVVMEAQPEVNGGKKS